MSLFCEKNTFLPLQALFKKSFRSIFRSVLAYFYTTVTTNSIYGLYE